MSVRLLFFLFVSLFGIQKGYSQNPFPHLKAMELPALDCGVRHSIAVYYDASISDSLNIEVKKLPVDHALYTPYGPDIDETLVIKTKLNRADQKEYFVVFNTGVSCDPGFYFMDLETEQIVGVLPGTKLYLPGNGKLYTSGYINAPFNIKRKYVLEEGKFAEVVLEFYDVSLKTKTLAPIRLYKTQKMEEELAYLPAGYAIEVVLAAPPLESFNGYYLIKTEFGLLGWTKVGTGEILNLIWRGD